MRLLRIVTTPLRRLDLTTTGAAVILLLAGCGSAPPPPAAPCPAEQSSWLPSLPERPFTAWTIDAIEALPTPCLPAPVLETGADVLPAAGFGGDDWARVIPAGCSAAFPRLTVDETVDHCGRITSVCVRHGDGGAIDAAVARHLIRRGGGRPATLHGRPVPTVISLFPFRRLLAERAEARRFREPFDDVDDIARLVDSHAPSAYVRLGQIGTAESLAALRSIEARARTEALNSRSVLLASGLGRVSATSQRGTVYTVVQGTLRDIDSMYLVVTPPGEEPARLPKPYLLPLKPRATPAYWSLRVVSADRLILTMPVSGARPGQRETWHPGDFDLSLAAIMRDTDADGVTDVEERRMALDPANRDTDGDGLPDGVDQWPDLPGPAGRPPSEDARMLQRAVFAAFGTSASGALFIAHPSAPPIEIPGYEGRVLYSPAAFEAARAEKRPARFVAWRILCRAGSDAVTAAVSMGGLQGYDDVVLLWWVDLAKRGGEWVVTRVQPEFG